MRIVITGGAGFIGRSLAADLTATGYEVVILSNAHASGDGGVEAERMNRLWAQQGMTVVPIADLDVASLCP